MEALYIKLYEKYSKLKAGIYGPLDQLNQEQEVKFMEFVSAAENLIKHLTTENKRLYENIDELRREIFSLGSAKDQQFDDFQQRLMEEKRKSINQELSAGIEQLQNLQQERLQSGNESGQHEKHHVNSAWHSPSVSQGQFTESRMRMTRKRARLSTESDPARNSPSVSHVELSTGKGLLADQSKRDASKARIPLAECCRSNTDNGGPSKCVFQGLVECLIGMKLSVLDQPEGSRIHAVHPSSGYSFSLTWVNKVSPDGGLLYHVSSLGTFANVAPERMREVIIFSMSMCPIFFDRLSHVIKNH